MPSRRFVSAIGSVGSSSLAIAATSRSSIRAPQIVKIRDGQQVTSTTSASLPLPDESATYSNRNALVTACCWLVSVGPAGQHPKSTPTHARDSDDPAHDDPP